MHLKIKKTIKKYIITLSIGIFVALFLKLFCLDFLTISGTSMAPTLKENQTIVINKLAYGLNKPFSSEFLIQWASPKKDDVIIFLHDNKIVVKRAVLLQNEYLEILYNEQYNYYYIQVGQRKIKINGEQKKNLEKCSTVPKGYVFAVGDNDVLSIDSRDYGFVSVKNITGRVIGK